MSEEPVAHKDLGKGPMSKHESSSIAQNSGPQDDHASYNLEWLSVETGKDRTYKAVRMR